MKSVEVPFTFEVGPVCVGLTKKQSLDSCLPTNTAGDVADGLYTQNASRFLQNSTRKSPKKKCYEEKMCGWQASGCDDNVGWRVMKKIGTKRQPFGFNDDDNSEKKVKSTVHITCPLCRPGRYVSAGKPPTASFHTTHPGVALNAIANSIEGHKMAIVLYFMT